MKKSKNIKRVLSEGLVELILTLICLGIGVFIISLFGANLESSNMDFDLVILLGLVVFFTLFGLIHTFIQLLKKAFKRKSK